MDATVSNYFHDAAATDVVAEISEGEANIRIGFSNTSRIATTVFFETVEELRKFVRQAAAELRKHDDAEQFAEHLDREKREDFAR